MKKLLIVATALAATTLTLVGIAPAQASTTGYYVKRDRDVVLQPACRNYAAPYSVPSSINARPDWRLEVDLLSPTGRELGTYVVAKRDGDPATGRFAVQLCGGFRTGTYRLVSTLFYTDGVGLLIGGVESGQDSMTDTFRVRRA